MLSCRFFKENLGKLDYEAVATHFDDYGLYCVNRNRDGRVSLSLHPLL